MNPATTLPVLLGLAWLLPLASFVLIVFFGRHMGHHGKAAAYVACGAIISGCVLSLVALLFCWLPSHPFAPPHHGAESASHTAASESGETASISHADPAVPSAYSGDWYALVDVGPLHITIGYYIDALTVAMFCMVTLIASCIHVYAIGYMHDELHEVTDHEVTLADGHPLHRPGRFHRFFQYLSLFSFSMLGLVISGNLVMTFVFWELVGICSYFLIGFYFERKSASNAANKAFIVNRIGDFGFIIGLMVFFGALGTLNFGGDNGLFAQIRPGPTHLLIVPASMTPTLLVVAGLGIFCGCVGKSTSFRYKCGCPMRWKARRRFRPWCIRRRWWRPVCFWSDAAIRFSHKMYCW